MLGVFNGWTHSIRNHGAFALKQVTWAFGNLARDTDDPLVKKHMAQHYRLAPGADEIRELLYLHEDNSLSPKTPLPIEKPFTYTFAPEHPVPTIGSSSASPDPVATAGAFDQREKEYKGDPKTGYYGSRPPYLPLKARQDIMIYQTPVLEKDMTVSSPGSCDWWRVSLFSSHPPDTGQIPLCHRAGWRRKS